MKIYLVGPISGESYDDVINAIEIKRSTLEDIIPGAQVYHPMTGKSALRNEIEFKSVGYNEIAIATNRAIFGRDKWMVRQADVIIADFRGASKASIGSMFELAWGHILGKLVVVMMEDDNVHQHAFVLEAADVIFTDFKDVVVYLKNIQRGEYGDG